jgi:hypothetical protein
MALPKAAIGFAAFASWDARGASWFGYETAWINRLAAPPELISDGAPIFVAQDMSGVLRLAGDSSVAGCLKKQLPDELVCESGANADLLCGPARKSR